MLRMNVGSDASSACCDGTRRDVGPASLRAMAAQHSVIAEESSSEPLSDGDGREIKSLNEGWVRRTCCVVCKVIARPDLRWKQSLFVIRGLR